jgi:ABC-type multidrug transport system ATPase subunit
MFNGMFAPTEGYVTVAGKDIRTEMDGIRQEIGICLQHDCFFPELTVREHVDFFAQIKGMYARMSAKFGSTLVAVVLASPFAADTVEGHGTIAKGTLSAKAVLARTGVAIGANA